MMDRRTFLRRLAVLVVTTALIPSLFKAQRDDTDRAQAMLDAGEPLVGQTFYLSRPLVIGARGITAFHCTFLTLPGFPRNAPLIAGAGGPQFSQNEFMLL